MYTTIHIQTWIGPKGFSRLRFPELLDNRRMKVARFSPNAPAAFTSQEMSLLFISASGWTDTRVIMRPEGLSQWKVPLIVSNPRPSGF
jgi:hypothetical protein